MPSILEEDAQQQKFPKHIEQKLEDAEEKFEHSPGYEARQTFAWHLEKIAVELIGRRQDVEDRWIQQAIQYAGAYDSRTIENIRKRVGASELFVNLTRPKTTVLRSRITDVMLPEDSPNWSMKASPVPDLPEWAIQEVREELEGLAASLPVEEGQPPLTLGELDDDTIFQFVKNKADEIADRAYREMSDQLNECEYAGELFKVIHECCKFGSGVMKGPLMRKKTIKRWETTQQEDGATAFVQSEVQVPRPVYQAVHCWDCYPDPEATRIDEAEYVFELHRWSRKQVRQATKQLGFYKEAARAVLRENPRLSSVYNSFHQGLREIERGDTFGRTSRFYVWEYRGPADPEVLESVIDELGDVGQELAEVLGFTAQETLDPLESQNIVCYFCQGHVLLLEPDILDTGELPYSWFTLDPDESSLYGDGVPGFIEHPQRALNAAWRLTMDTGGLSGLPMFVVDDSVQPTDGVYNITAGKVWRRNSSSINNDGPGIVPIQIAPSVSEGLTIAEASRALMNDESMIPALAHEDVSGATQQTAHGMTLLVNAVNTTFRQIVRSIDLFMTTPNIKRLYQWNRQFGPEFIDGDVDIQALGSSVLLVREIQAGQRMTALNLVAGDPELGDHVNKGELFKLVLEAMQLPTDKLLYDPEIAEQRRSQRLQAEAEALAADGQSKLEVEQLRQDSVQQTEQTRQQTELARLEAQKVISDAKIAAELRKTQLKVDADQRKAAAEIFVKRTQGTGF